MRTSFRGRGAGSPDDSEAERPGEHQEILLVSLDRAQDSDPSLGLCRYGADARATYPSGRRRSRNGGAPSDYSAVGVLLVDEVDQSRSILIFELARLEGGGLLLHDVPRQIENFLRDFHVIDLIEMFGRISG